MKGRLICLAAVLGCNQSDFGPPGFGDDPPPGPGSPTWNDTDLSCSQTSDCAPGETCDDGFCRPKQCDDGPYSSAAPLGPDHLFFRDEELLVIDSSSSQGAYWVDAYGAAGSIDYHGAGGGSYSMGTAPLTDVARIATASGPGMVVATQGQSIVTITGSAISAKTIDVGLVPVAVAAGDIDGDEQDDVIAASADGHIAVCPQSGACKAWSFDHFAVTDVAAGDIDGDGIAEVLLLGTTNGTTETIAWKADANSSVAATFESHFKAITAGDFDRDGRAEVALLEDGGWLGLATDRVHQYRVGAQWTGISSVSTLRSSVDLASGDTDGSDSGDSVIVLGSNRSVDILRWNGQGLASTGSGSVDTTSSPMRIALGDVDGDSVAARLVSGPDLVSGGLSPMVVVTFPPYDATYSRGQTSGVGVGNRTDMTTDLSTTVSLEAGVEVGVGADFLSIFSARLSTRVAADVSHTHSVDHMMGVGTRFSLKPQVDLYGDHYGAVVVGCNCFHAYTYELVDPANRAGGTGHRMVMVVPVGGTTTVLSTPRYGSLAQKSGKLPLIDVKTKIGDPSSYPRSPTKLDGSPVQPDEQVFPTRPTLNVSDVGTVAFSLSVGTSTTNTTAMHTSVSISGSLGALGVTFGSSLGASWGQSFSLIVGNTADFSGDVPPLPDDPKTPEDEYHVHGFAYSPYVYRMPFMGTTGDASGYYVIDYAVGTP